MKSLCTPPPPGFNLAWLCTLEGDGVTTVLRGTARADTICGHGSGERMFGGRGGDVLRAGGGADTVYGEAGADQITGGAGRDILAAGPGDDILFARDGARDRVVCGSGRDDVAIVDRGDVLARGCETVNRPPRRKPPRLEAELVAVRAGVDLAQLEHLVHVLARLRKRDPLVRGDPLVHVRLPRVVGGEREPARRRTCACSRRR